MPRVERDHRPEGGGAGAGGRGAWESRAGLFGAAEWADWQLGRVTSVLGVPSGWGRRLAPYPTPVPGVPARGHGVDAFSPF